MKALRRSLVELLLDEDERVSGPGGGPGGGGVCGPSASLSEVLPLVTLCPWLAKRFFSSLA